VYLANQVAKVQRLEVKKVGMIRLGEHEQVVDDVHHPVDLVGDQGDGFLPLLGSLVESEQFRVAPDDRQWRA